MAKDLILTKESSESEIKAYFDAVLKLSQLDNEFPINFDEVWMLVYQDKHKAVYELKDKFIEDVIIRQSPKRWNVKTALGIQDGLKKDGTVASWRNSLLSLFINF